MSGIGAKLSRHVLGMKFMRKTKDQIEKVNVENSHREHFAPAASQVKSETSQEIKSEPSTSTSTPGTPIVEELWSYNQCERYIFGRQSFGGFNPVVENNVRKGIWKPFYLDEARNVEDSDEDEDLRKQSDVDVSDEEMAKTFGSLVGTLAKRFKKKFKKEESKSSLSERPDFDNPNRKKPNKWSKKFQNNKKNSNQNQRGNADKGKNWNKKRQRESTGSTAHYSNQDEDGAYQHEHPQQNTPRRKHGYSNDNEDRNVPPQKKRKFMKPSDD